MFNLFFFQIIFFAIASEARRIPRRYRFLRIDSHQALYLPAARLDPRRCRCPPEADRSQTIEWCPAVYRRRKSAIIHGLFEARETFEDTRLLGGLLEMQHHRGKRDEKRFRKYYPRACAPAVAYRRFRFDEECPE